MPDSALQPSAQLRRWAIVLRSLLCRVSRFSCTAMALRRHECVVMKRLVHSRLLLVLLAVLLQVAMLPGQGRFQCMLRTGSMTSCCCAIEAPALTVESEVAPATDTAKACCHALVVDAKDQIPALDRSCNCGSDSTDVLFAPSFAIGYSDGVSSGDDDESSGALPPRTVLDPQLREIAKRMALRVVPWAATGPPLYLRFQTFLI